MLTGISVVCFAASYSVAFALELTRLFFRARVRTAVMIAFAAAGLFAHTVYLIYEFQQRWENGIVLVTWFTGCLSLAWIFVASYLASMMVRQKSSTGLIILPTSLALIAASQLFPHSAAGIRYWGILHGLSIVFGIAMVVIGFVAGLMYLFQSYRLKQQKLPPTSSVWLPSLERLQTLNERCLYASIGLLGIGLISGILLNLTQMGEQQGIPWSDPVVLASMVWITWLLTMLLFNTFYRHSRSGRKVAYLTVGSFVFLGIVLTIMFWMPSVHVGSPSQVQFLAPSTDRWFVVTREGV
ncbi:MAG: hypothetical protein P8N76_03710 [Pirellulaceae bacterium]|nr:hypothetical protein [Pirellulaceae bacterium]